MKTKTHLFEFPRSDRPLMNYTLIFGDYVLVLWTHSGSPYWTTREDAETRLKENHFPGSKIVQTGTVLVPETGCYYTDETEFMDCMRLLRAKLVE